MNVAIDACWAEAEEVYDGLYEFITTNVMDEVRPLTRRILEEAAEAGSPWMYTRQFEVGPEKFPPAV